MTRTQYKPFPAVNCERIRKLQAIITASEKRREDAFAARDHALEQIHVCGEAEADKLTRLKADHSDAICSLEREAKTIKWARKELANTIEKADEEGLFDSADVDVPDWDAEEKADEDDRPVGDAGEQESGETIEDYLPGRYRDQNGQERNIADMDALRAAVQEMAPGASMTPRVSKSYGVKVDVIGTDGRIAGCLQYVGKARGRRGAA